MSNVDYGTSKDTYRAALMQERADNAGDAGRVAAVDAELAALDGPAVVSRFDNVVETAVRPSANVETR